MLISLDAILTNSIHQTVDRPQPPFLPPLEGDKKYTLVLDMDETLIHYKEIEGAQNAFLIRPYCQEFLDEMAKHYEIVIFTAAVKQYADTILDSIDQKKRIAYRLYREHTRL
jgi:CTD small phosphatase-like protein 2